MADYTIISLIKLNVLSRPNEPLIFSSISQFICHRSC